MVEIILLLLEKTSLEALRDLKIRPFSPHVSIKGRDFLILLKNLYLFIYFIYLYIHIYFHVKMSFWQVMTKIRSYSALQQGMLKAQSQVWVSWWKKRSPQSRMKPWPPKHWQYKCPQHSSAKSPSPVEQSC